MVSDMKIKDTLDLLIYCGILIVVVFLLWGIGAPDWLLNVIGAGGILYGLYAMYKVWKGN